jgi:histidine ammonia-lyase
VTLSRGVEDDASFASLAAVNALNAARAYRTLAACELVVAVRAVRMRDDRNRACDHGATMRAVLDLCSVLDPALADRDLTDDIEVASGLIGALGSLL